MPDLGNPLKSLSSSLATAFLPVLYQCDSSKGCSTQRNETLDSNLGELLCQWDRRSRFSISSRGYGVCNGKTDVLETGIVAVKKQQGVSGPFENASGKSLDCHRFPSEDNEQSCSVDRESWLPFMCNAPRMVDCCICRKSIVCGEEALCSVRDCQGVFHRKCADQQNGTTFNKALKCPQHMCFICKQKVKWHCIRCSIAAHRKCSPWPDSIITLPGEHRLAICWRHPEDWRCDEEHTAQTSEIEEAFRRLPLPYVKEEFNIDSLLKEFAKPDPYAYIKRNVYLIKKKLDGVSIGVGCTNCDYRSTCKEDCECRGQSVSCSKACRCSDLCNNRPFRKEKKIRVIKTQYCGWGVEAAEPIKKGEFIIEYVGEVINDAECEQRLWDMKYKGDQNFYMCEIQKDFTIDATFKGNNSRFLNHSCDPNCKLEKWQVDGETRVGVFASRSIEIGESLTYDYRFEHFGPMVECHCGATNCQGYFGSKKKINNKEKVIACWGCKRRRTSLHCGDN